MSDGFSLYFPFILPASRDIKDLPHGATLAGQPAELKEVTPHIAIEVRGIPTKLEARKLFDRFTDAIHWAALDTGVGVQFETTLDEGYRPDDPVQAAKNMEATCGLKRDRIDVFVDGGRPHVRNDADRVLTVTGQPISFRLSYDPAKFARAVEAGLDVFASAGPIPPQLKTAVELYSCTHFETFARFLALFIPLERAAPDGPAHDAVVAKVETWQKDLRSVIQRYPKDDPARQELEGLESRLGQLAKESHTGRIREFVRTRLEGAGHKDADQQADAIVRLYKKRGQLTHEGAGDVSQDMAELESIVRKTLMAAWTTVANA